MLGRVVEVASGGTLYEFMSERILEPLGMRDTGFYVDRPAQARTHRRAVPEDDRTIGIDTTFNDPRVAQKWESGGGGMVGTAMDYARFLQMLLDGGTLDGKRVLGAKTIAYMTADHLDGSIGAGPCICPAPASASAWASRCGTSQACRRCPGRWASQLGGAGGTYFWVDPREDLFVVFMMQSPKQRVYYRALLKDMVYGAVIPAGARNGQGRR